ncbi:hypothetical protein BKA61DRAFT_683121 [Leptodontidium sp. MPI-SDFR-AT-0119]|nr:hypothetical protein BKA61DRAFT_683121 [Leptodontidium sp. MPI-SDFR-AT-0119]
MSPPTSQMVVICMITGLHAPIDLSTTQSESRDIAIVNNRFHRSSKPPAATCGNVALADLDYQTAKSTFGGICTGQMLKKGQHLYAKYGDAMVFRCAHGNSPCSFSDAKTYLAQVDTQCLPSGYSGPPIHETGYVKVDKGRAYGVTTAQSSAC